MAVAATAATMCTNQSKRVRAWSIMVLSSGTNRTRQHFDRRFITLERQSYSVGVFSDLRTCPNLCPEAAGGLRRSWGSCPLRRGSPCAGRKSSAGVERDDRAWLPRVPGSPRRSGSVPASMSFSRNVGQCVLGYTVSSSTPWRRSTTRSSPTSSDATRPHLEVTLGPSTLSGASPIGSFTSPLTNLPAPATHNYIHLRPSPQVAQPRSHHGAQVVPRAPLGMLHQPQ